MLKDTKIYIVVSIVLLSIITFIINGVVIGIYNRNNRLAEGVSAVYTPYYELKNHSYIDGLRFKAIIKDMRKKSLDPNALNIRLCNSVAGCTIEPKPEKVNVKKRYLIVVDENTGFTTATEGGY